MAGPGKGAALALANTVVIGVALCLAFPDANPWFKPLVMAVLMGCIPAVVTGVLLGMVADALQLRPLLRVPVLAAPAIGMVAVIGRSYGFTEYILPACIPTVAAAVALERWTRVPSDAPVARAL